MNLCNSIHVSQMEKNVCLSSVWGQTPNSWWNLKRTETKWELRVRPAGSTPSSFSVDSTWYTLHRVQIYSNRWFSLYLDLCSDKFCGIITFGYGYKHLRQRRHICNININISILWTFPVNPVKKVRNIMLYLTVTDATPSSRGRDLSPCRWWGPILPWLAPGWNWN